MIGIGTSQSAWAMGSVVVAVVLGFAWKLAVWFEDALAGREGRRGTGGKNAATGAAIGSGEPERASRPANAPYDHEDDGQDWEVNA